MKEIYLAGGCFWGAEHYFSNIEGVVDTEVGFANGDTPSPTYEQVYTDTTGYAETVKVVYDPSVISLAELVRDYFVEHGWRKSDLNKVCSLVGVERRVR